MSYPLQIGIRYKMTEIEKIKLEKLIESMFGCNARLDEPMWIKPAGGFIVKDVDIDGDYLHILNHARTYFYIEIEPETENVEIEIDGNKINKNRSIVNIEFYPKENVISGD